MPKIIVQRDAILEMKGDEVTTLRYQVLETQAGTEVEHWFLLRSQCENGKILRHLGKTIPEDEAITLIARHKREILSQIA